MFRFVSVLTILAVLASQASAQEDETDLSRYALVEDGESIPTLDDLAVQEATVRDYLAAGDCATALPLLADLSKKTNTVANIVAQGVKPYYQARRDDQKVIAQRPGFSRLVDAERKANALKAKRNEFWFLEARCHVQLGDRDKAIPRLFRALRFIDGRQQEPLWLDARQLLWSTIGYPEK